MSPLRLGVLAGVAAVLLLAAGIAVWQIFSKRNAQAERVNVAIAQSEDAYNKGDFVNALNLVRNMGKGATSSEQKARVYQAAAQAANAANLLQDAAKFYELKHRADPGSVKRDAYTLGVIYERLEQKDKALAQYKLALEYAKSTKNQYGSDAAGIQASIDALEGRE